MKGFGRALLMADTGFLSHFFGFWYLLVGDANLFCYKMLMSLIEGPNTLVTTRSSAVLIFLPLDMGAGF